MGDVTAEQTQAYIDAYYITLPDLARRAAVSEARVLEFVENRCIPPHSYEVRGETTCINSFGAYALPSVPRLYYHPRLVDWIDRASSLAERQDLPAVAARVKADFEADIDRALAGRPMPWPDGTTTVWAYLMDGTWGLCLKTLTVPDLVQKELARATIARIEKASAGRSITSQERFELEEAVALYDDVALPFSPHELGESSRCLEVGTVVRKHGLALPQDAVAAE